MKYKEKPAVVDAYQWFRDSEHKDVQLLDYSGSDKKKCKDCDGVIHDHGLFMSSSVDGWRHSVCPGDWVIKSSGGRWICKPDVFKRLYESINE